MNKTEWARKYEQRLTTLAPDAKLLAEWQWTTYSGINGYTRGEWLAMTEADREERGV